MQPNDDFATGGTVRRARGARSLTAGLLAIWLALASVFVASAASDSAQASGTSTITTSHATLRLCIDTTKTGCAGHGYFAKGSATMICWADAPRSATGAYSSKRYFFLTQGTRKGFAHSSWVTHQIAVPNCSQHVGVSALRWAAEQIGHVTMPAAVAVWGGETADPTWSGGCALFTSAAYYFGAAHVTPHVFGNAGSRYYAYRARGAIRPMSSEPLIGTQIFWPNSTSRGHVAIYAGRIGGTAYVVSTTGDTGADLPVKLVTLSSIGTAAGWLPTSSL